MELQDLRGRGCYGILTPDDAGGYSTLRQLVRTEGACICSQLRAVTLGYDWGTNTPTLGYDWGTNTPAKPSAGPGSGSPGRIPSEEQCVCVSHIHLSFQKVGPIYLVSTVLSIVPLDNCALDNCALDNCALDNCALDNCALDNCAP